MQRSQPLLQTSFIFLVLPVLLNKGVPAGALAVPFIVAGILVMVTLVVLFRTVKRLGRQNRRHNRSGETSAGLQRRLGGFRLLPLLFGVGEDGGAV
ncbi:hypothetical protein D3C75_1199080 [compost metagenome]